MKHPYQNMHLMLRGQRLVTRPPRTLPGVELVPQVSQECPRGVHGGIRLARSLDSHPRNFLKKMGCTLGALNLAEF